MAIRGEGGWGGAAAGGGGCVGEIRLIPRHSFAVYICIHTRVCTISVSTLCTIMPDSFFFGNCGLSHKRPLCLQRQQFLVNYLVLAHCIRIYVLGSWEEHIGTAHTDMLCAELSTAMVCLWLHGNGQAIVKPHMLAEYRLRICKN